MTDAITTGYLHFNVAGADGQRRGTCANIKFCERKRQIGSAVQMILVRSAS
jgi:hypothetical protein